MSWIKLREIKDWADKYVAESPSEVFFYRPYISDTQTLMILDLLERLKPTKCLEWGAGWSTIFFPRFVPSATWVSIEHLRQFYLMLSPHLPLNATIICEEVWGNYVTRALDEQPVDFVFVDGERREECIITASIILRNGGVVVMHNAGDLDIPIKFKEEDVRLRFKEHGRIRDFWKKMTLMNINGIIIYFDHEEDKAIINEVFFEDVYRVSKIPEKSMVLDIGAHIGTFAIRCAHERKCTVFAYEPSSRNFNLLVKNIELNHLGDKIKVFNQGVAKCSEMRTFYFRPTGPQGSSFFFHGDAPYKEELAQCTTLRRVFEDNRIFSCGILKMDCEEAEKEIFTDEFSPYIKSVDCIMVEWHNYDGHIYAEYLEKLGFSVLLTGTGVPQPKYDPSFARGMLYAHKVL